MKIRDRVSAAVNVAIAALGSGTAVLVAIALVVAWLAVGVVREFDTRWVDVLHGVAAATTFLMVFMLRHSESRDMRAVLVKLDELVAAVEGTDEEVIGIEQADLHEQEEAEKKISDS